MYVMVYNVCVDCTVGVLELRDRQFFHFPRHELLGVSINSYDSDLQKIGAKKPLMMLLIVAL